MGQNPELGDGVDRRLKNESSVHGVDIVGAVDQEIVRFRPLAVDCVSLALARGAAGLEQSGSQGHDAGLKQSQLREVAAIQRQVKNLALHRRLRPDC